MKLNNMTATELRELIAAAQQQLEKLDAGKVQVSWAVDWHRADRQKPYLAIINKAAEALKIVNGLRLRSV